MRQVLFNSNEHSSIEAGVSEKPESYRNLSEEALYTSQEDFKHIFSHPLVTGTFADLGCGTGMGSLLYAKMFPERVSLGVDIEEARLLQGKKIQENIGIQNAFLSLSNLLTDDIPVADTYFLYFPTGHILDKILTGLYSLKRKFTLIAIESHGDLLPRLELETWLSLKAEIPLSSQRHYPNARIYVSTFAERKVPEAFLVSYEDLAVLIQDEQGLWVGNTFNLKWERNNLFTLFNPPRTIEWSSVKTLKARSDCDKTLQEMMLFREAGLVMIETQARPINGYIRKIYLSPVFHLEISTGEKVELSQILKINIRN